MANAETLDKVYTAIGTLRAKGISQLDVGLVANVAGIARSTLYLNDADWQEVRAVIKGKPSSRVKLVPVNAEAKSQATQQIESLLARITEAEEEVAHIQSVADTVYRELIDEVQRWFAKASETPAKQAKTAQFINELNIARKELDRLRSENRMLEARLTSDNVVRPLVKKEVIFLNNVDSPGEFFSSFLRQLETILHNGGTSHGITAAYLTCGLPLAGKSSWIETHQPDSPGVYLYIDSCAHTVDSRRFIADRIRDTTNAAVHCVWLMASEPSCNRRVSLIGAGAVASLKESQIRRVSSTFEEPTFEEPFNSFILL